MYAGEFAGSAWRALRTRDGIDKLADVYVQTIGTATLDELGAAMDTTAYQFSYLPTYLGGEQGGDRDIGACGGNAEEDAR